MLSARDWLQRRRKISRGFARLNAGQIKQYEQFGKPFSELKSYC
jgi:hypothetical protein